MEGNIRIDDLIAACNSLGQLDANDGIYMKDRDCKACIKEIIRDLNNDNKQHTARCTLGSLNIVKSDLIPIINQYCDFNDGDLDLFSLVLRLCTNLTSSVLLLYENQQKPTEIEDVKVYSKLMKCLYSYKLAFSNDITIWERLNTHLRHEEDEVPFERLLVLIRNVLHIPVDLSGEFGLPDDFDAHDMCIHWMDKSGMLQTIVEIASDTQRGSEFCFHIMEIVYLILRDKNPVTIASALPNNGKRKLEEEDEDIKRLNELRSREKSAKTARNSPAPRFKHSFFAVQNIRSIGDAPVILNRLPGKYDFLGFDSGKDDVKRPKNRKPFNSEKFSTVLSDRNTRPTRLAYSLKVFCKQFTEKVYANYMQQIKHNLIQKKAAENDESYYLWAVQFFTAFNRQMHMSMDNISETLSTSTLHFIQILINDYQDKLKLEKKRSNIEKISRRLHLALRAYREILLLIQSTPGDSEFKVLMDQIKKKIYTEVEYSSMLFTLFHQYDDYKHCPEYLNDLITTTEVFLDLGSAYQNLSSYYCVEILKAYSYALKNFKRNDSSLNLSILRYFECLLNERELGVMLMQASIFKTLLDIIDDGHIVGYERFVQLSKDLSAKFVALSAEKRFMYQELLFWKSQTDVFEIENNEEPPAEITAAVVDDLLNVDEEGEGQPLIPDAEEGLVDEGRLSPLSQISGVDDQMRSDEHLNDGFPTLPSDLSGSGEESGFDVDELVNSSETSRPAEVVDQGEPKIIEGSKPAEASEVESGDDEDDEVAPVVARTAPKRGAILESDDENPPSPTPSPPSQKASPASSLEQNESPGEPSVALEH